MYQVQESVLPRPKHGSADPSDALLDFQIVEKPFSFKVMRKENGEVLFDTSGVPLVYEAQYIRLRTKMPANPNLYGLGEHSDSFRLGTDGYTRTFWNRESPDIPEQHNLYGTHPVYFDHRGAKGTHGVFMLNANGMDINIDKINEGQMLEYNILGGVIDLYFLAGKTPTDVSRQYADTVGYPAMFPYWSLGFHQCRYGYRDVYEVAEVVANYSNAGIPLEVMWTDIDYMDHRRDFTTDLNNYPISKMRVLVDTLHGRDQRYVLILDPAVQSTLSREQYPTYRKGHDMGIFLKAENGKDDYLGVQWAGISAWPDWFHPKTIEWWNSEFQRVFSADTGVDIDGIWVDMNEGSNFCHDVGCDLERSKNGFTVPEPRPNTGRPINGFPKDFQPGPPSRIRRNSDVKIERQNDPECPRHADFNTMKGTIGRNTLYPQYKINNNRAFAPLSSITIWTNLTNCDGTNQYDTHNLYGAMMARTTREVMSARRPSLRPFVLTRSTFAGSGRDVAHWFGDNHSWWSHYRTSIKQMLAFVAMHQMPMVGSDVCGFNGDTSVELCARWAMLGAFQPFYRNHAELSTISQEFYRWPEVAQAAKKAIVARYKVLDYAYTAMHKQSTTGAPMVNPLFFLFPEDTNTFHIDTQWFYGDSLLISPVVEDNSDTVQFYLPKGVWYDYWTSEKLVSSGQYVQYHNLALDDIPVHIRGGSIIPQRMESANTTTALRKVPFQVLVAPDENGRAKGSLYLDDGESLEQRDISEAQFTYENGRFEIKGSFGFQSAGQEFSLDKIIVLGTVNEPSLSTGVTWQSESKTTTVHGPGILKGGNQMWTFTLQ